VGCGFAFLVDHQATATLHTPRQIDRFILLQQVGEGAFGVVWKARDTELNRIVALKIPRSRGLEQSQIDAFVREAKAAAPLRHPNIVPVHEVRTIDSQPCIICEFIDGPTLSQWMNRNQPLPMEAAGLVRRLAIALDYAHRHGIVHRDVKPSNILLDDEGVPFIGDFGLAKRADENVTVTIEGQIIGTPAYMSPEQARGKGCFADARSDIYSLGVILYELLTGERPFRGSFTMILQQVIHDDPPSLKRLNQRIPRDLEVICLKCLEKDPGCRYTTSADLADDLTRFIDGDSIAARPINTAEKIWRWYCRNSHAAMIVAGALTILNALVLTGWGLFGIAVVLLRWHPVDRPELAAVQLAAIIVAYYGPWIAIGFFTLNGYRYALYIGTVLCVLSFAYSVAMVAGWSPALELEVLKEAKSNAFIRFQLSGLLMFMAIGLSVAHFVALAARSRGQVNANTSTTIVQL
jgi:tRNA A-37 threonylcarbamoyl transferase component Bud32